LTPDLATIERGRHDLAGDELSPPTRAAQTRVPIVHGALPGLTAYHK
jgi:hypothetical protein